MAESAEIKIRYYISVFGEVNNEGFRQQLKKKADQCRVPGIVCPVADEEEKLEIILEGEKGAASKVLVWLAREPRLAKIKRLNIETEEFLGEFKEKFKIV